MNNTNYSLDFELNDNNFLSNLFGIDDKNIQIIEKNNNVKIKYRGNKIKIIGSKVSIKDTKEEPIIQESRSIHRMTWSNTQVSYVEKVEKSWRGFLKVVL